MDDLLGWLPHIGLLAVGIGLGIASRRLGRGARRALYLAPFAIGCLTAILVWRSPPCPDLLDGPCEQNWVSDTAAVGFVALRLTALVAATLAVTRATGRARST